MRSLTRLLINMKEIKRKPIAVLITDVHLDKNNTALVEDIFSQLLAVCREKHVYNIICAGDVFTSRSGQPLECLSSWQKILKMSKGVEIIAIPGNHDKTDANDERSYLDIYDRNEKFFRLCRVGETVFIEDVRFDFIPYFGRERWEEELGKLKKLNNKDVNILVTHMGFNGVRNNDGTEVTDSIPPSAVSEYDLVLVGHYHNRSKVGKNIFYTGSAYQNNYGENCTDKGFTVIYDDASVEFVSSKFPRYIKETIQATDRETLANLLEKYGTEEREDHVRFEFVGKKADLETLDVTDIENRYGIDCKFVSVEEKEAIEGAVGEDVLNYDSASITKNFYRFCTENNIRGAELKYGVGLMKILKCGLQ